MVSWRRRQMMAAAVPLVQEEYIVFADPVVAQICATNWGDGIGITPSQAAAVTSLGDVFQGNTSIVSFDELQYFTGLTGLGFSCFSGCTSLQTITIPALAASNFARLVFYNCTSLERIYLKGPCGPYQWTNFLGCTSLTRIDFDRLSDWLDSQLSNEQGFFSASGSGSVYINGVEATNVIIPDGYTTINPGIFAFCRNLLSVSIPNTVRSIGMLTFSYCTGLTSIQIPYGLTTIGDEAFMSCTGLTSIDLPASVTSIGGHAFSSIGNGFTSLVCRATTPPACGNAFRYDANLRIYVPAASVAAYKAASGWSTYADRIEAIP